LSSNEVVGEHHPRRDPRLVPSATFADLDIASLDIISVSFAIEDKFGLVVEPEAFADCTCLGDVVSMIQAQGVAKAA
jgi:acyl carrier protein